MGDTTQSDVPQALKERLVRENAEVLMATGMPEGEAWEMAEVMFARAVERARDQGTLRLPTGMGDRLLREERENDGIRSMLAKKRADGVTDEDIRWWWNMHDLERQMLVVQDDASRTVVSVYWMDQGLPVEEAVAKAQQALVTYGDPEEPSAARGDDRPLPYELKDRINRFMLQGSGNPSELKRRIRSFSSMNAFIRAEMRVGRL
jgi:hypothetical protein